MKAIQEEKFEYEKFMVELAHKAQETQNELEKVLAARGLAGVMEHINRMK